MLDPETRSARSDSCSGLDAAAVGRAILDSGVVAVIGMDRGGRIVAWSEAAESMFGHERGNVLGRELARVLVPPSTRSAHREGLRHYLATGESAILGTPVAQSALRADGGEFPVELWVVPIEEGSEPGFVGFVRDLTRHRQAEFELAKSRALLAAAETVARTGSFEHDLQSGEVRWSGGLRRLAGVGPAQRPGSVEDILALVHPDDREAARESVGEAIAELRPRLRRQLRIVRPDGEERSVELLGLLVLDDDGRPDRIVGTVRDITDEIRATRARELLAQMIESSEDAIFTKGPDGTITSWNHGAELLYGYKPAEAIGRHVSLLAPDGLHDEQEQLTARVFAGESTRRLETERLRRDGERLWVSLNVTPIRDAGGNIVSAAVLARDVTEPRRQREQLQYLSSHDLLTGLYDRRRFEDELGRELSRSARGGSLGAVLSIDVDGFRAINESVGHAAGDAALREIAHLLSGGVRGGDVVARIGGDEFAILLPDTGPPQARATAEHLLEAVRGRTLMLAGRPFTVTVSIGAAVFPPREEAAPAEEVLISADLALATAKEQGHDRVVVFDEDRARLARAGAKLSWSQRIRHALAHDGFRLWWQPIVEVATGQVSHGELLLRMCENDTVITPDAFLPAAERLGLIHLVDRWVISRAVALAASGHPVAATPLSVNLSAETVAGDPGILRFIESELRTAGVEPTRFIFEVTETAAIASLDEAGAFASDIRELGCRLAIDDFGTGFSSLSHLKHLPLDYIKIDREFIHDLATSEIDQRLVGSIVNLAATLQARTVAEAVQDEATMERLRELGVDYAQGYHLGRPEPV